ncbi:DUF1003 domain-containing protein [Gulosibacter molinativorax]|uniref:DUF1003 domain-containing protein n=1 Tax=Gulosibacter molinativorax TaxID=256821 RepID=A0ABT7C5V5_9MICO|nr:DUF1003 domain-containing protein [Gulosibacter molinativorax]MDJ1370570.1 DUF1003 domain-containing protein [Gulosibacter molinativorax]QUY62015.1 Membrane protein [Gulosibacter molinativorax]
MAEINENDDVLSVPKSESRRRPRRADGGSDDKKRGRRRDRKKEQREEDREDHDVLGRVMEAIARAMGTPAFLIGLTLFVGGWIAWNTLAPDAWRFDSSDLGFIALTLALSLQASYAAPMLLLAQNRQDDRDRVQIEQDRQRSERNTADLEYLSREVVALRMRMNDMASQDFIRAELRALLDEMDERAALSTTAATTKPAAGATAGTTANPESETDEHRA